MGAHEFITIGGRTLCLTHEAVATADDCIWRTIRGNPVCITAGHGGHGRETPAATGGGEPGGGGGHALSPEAAHWLAEIEQHPEIIKGKTLIKTGQATEALYRNADGTWDPDRVAAIHDPIVAKILDKPLAVPEPGQRPIAILYAGAGGAGKTTSLSQYVPGGKEAAKSHFVVINADDIKAELPEYTGYNAALVHEESAYLAEGRATKAAILQGKNILFDGTGKTGKKYLEMAEDFRKAGYEVQIMYAAVDPLVSTQRAVTRFLSMVAKGDPRPRYVDPSYLLNIVDAKPDQTYNLMKRSGLVDRAVKVDNNGKAPHLIEDVTLHPASESDHGPGGPSRVRVRAVGAGGRRCQAGAALAEAGAAGGDDACHWVTIGGNHVCITPGHTTGGFVGYGKNSKTVQYYHGGLLVPHDIPAAEQTTLLNRLKAPDGGFTYSPKTDSEPTEGFALSVHQDRQQILASAAEVTKQSLVDYTIKNWDLLSQEGNHLGAWNDPKTGKIYLDVATVVKSAAEAERLGRANNQLAYFDLKAGKSVEIAPTAKAPTPRLRLGDVAAHLAVGAGAVVAAGGLRAIGGLARLAGR